MNSLFKEIATKGIKALIIEALSLVLALVTNWVLAKHLGTELFGYYTYAFTWVTVLGTVSAWGYNSLINRELPKLIQQNDEEQAKSLIAHARLTTFVISILITVAFMLINYFFNNDNLLFKLVMIMSAIAIQFFPQILINNSIEIARKRIVFAQLPLKILKPGLLLIFIYFIAFYFPKNISVVVSLNIVAFIIAFLVGLIFSNKYFKLFAKTSKQNKNVWSKSAAGFLLLTLVVMLHSKADVLLLGFFNMADKAGIYAVSVAFSGLIALPLLVSNSVITPYIVEMIDNKKKELSQNIQRIMRLIFMGGSALFIIFIFIGKYLLGYFGDDFIMGYPVLIILGFAQLMNVYLGPVGNFLTMTHQVKLVTKTTIISLIISLIFSILLIYPFGINGVATGTAVGIIYWNLYLHFKIKSIYNIKISAF